MATGSMQIYEHEQQASCSLDLAERGGMTLTEVGDVLGITRERTRQIEALAMHKLRAVAEKRPDIADLLGD